VSNVGYEDESTLGWPGGGQDSSPTLDKARDPQITATALLAIAYLYASVHATLGAYGPYTVLSLHCCHCIASSCSFAVPESFRLQTASSGGAVHGSVAHLKPSKGSWLMSGFCRDPHLHLPGEFRGRQNFGVSDCCSWLHCSHLKLLVAAVFVLDQEAATPT
jgi:hypothetical protein